MSTDPYTIRIFVPDGDPEGVRIIDRMNWTGKGLVFPRSKWSETRKRQEFQQAGVYILVGDGDEDDDLPIVYVGEGDGIQQRIDDHEKKKDFWSWGLAFVSTNRALNKAHVQWLEYALVAKATELRRCRLDNGNVPREPELTESEKADTRGFLREILQILPLVGLRVFETPKAVVVAPGSDAPSGSTKPKAGVLDTVVVPAQRDGFISTFLGEDCWYAIRISGGMLDKIKWIAGYQANPVSAVTHVAEVARIEPYGDGSKYRVVFKGKAQPLPTPIPFGDAPSGSMQGLRYTSHEKLFAARKVADLF